MSVDLALSYRRSSTMLIRMIDAYLASLSVRGFSPRTIERRQWSLGRFEAHLAGRPLASASAEDVEGFLAGFGSPATRHAVWSDLRQLYVFGVRRGMVGANPVDLVDPPRVPNRSASPVPAGDVRRAIETAKPPVRLMLMLAAYAGLRMSEIARLRAEDVDIVERELMVRQGKGGRDEIVPLGRELRRELANWPTRGRYFPGADRHSISGHIRRHFDSLGIEGRPHDLRHSFGTMAARRTGGNMVAVAKLMRHTRIATSSRYVRLDAVDAELLDGLYADR